MKQVINAANAPAALGPYHHAAAAGDLVFVSGQIGIDPSVGKMVDGGVEAQARQAFTNIKNILAACGSSIENAVKTTVFLTDLNDFGKVNAIYAEFFGPDFPARSCFEVGGLPGGAAVECECIAVKSK